MYIVHVVIRYVYACAGGLVGHWTNSYCIAKIYTRMFYYRKTYALISN
jgi:hypothetical protein